MHVLFILLSTREVTQNSQICRSTMFSISSVPTVMNRKLSVEPKSTPSEAFSPKTLFLLSDLDIWNCVWVWSWLLYPDVQLSLSNTQDKGELLSLQATSIVLMLLSIKITKFFLHRDDSFFKVVMPLIFLSNNMVSLSCLHEIEPQNLI